MSKVEDEKLIVFGWIVTILGMESVCATDNNKLAQVNELVDKLHEIMEFRPREAVERVFSAGGSEVAISIKKPSERSYEAQKEELGNILGKFGVLTADGWSDDTKPLELALMKWGRNG